MHTCMCTNAHTNAVLGDSFRIFSVRSNDNKSNRGFAGTCNDINHYKTYSCVWFLSSLSFICRFSSTRLLSSAIIDLFATQIKFTTQTQIEQLAKFFNATETFAYDSKFLKWPSNLHPVKVSDGAREGRGGVVGVGGRGHSFCFHW
jgi:hypothetical protein